ncbi:MAG: hypothetical protein PHG67_14485 [Bacteroidales bacterium]|nr:hypothetical protein [Bacteroidales bacterium]
MKAVINILLIAISMLFTHSCKSPETIIRYVPLQNDSIVIEKPFPVQLPPDSASLTALFECDSLNNVVLKDIEQLEGRKLELLASFDALRGELKVLANQAADTVYLPGKETIIRQQIPIEVEKPVYINKLYSWQKLLMWTGAICLAILIVTIILKLKSLIP